MAHSNRMRKVYVVTKIDENGVSSVEEVHAESYDVGPSGNLTFFDGGDPESKYTSFQIPQMGPSFPAGTWRFVNQRGWQS